MNNISDYILTNEDMERISQKYNLKELLEYYKKCKSMTIDTININDLKELDEIKIDEKLPVIERMLDALSQGYNPYFYKCKGKIIQIIYGNQNKSLQECLMDLIAYKFKNKD